MFKTQKGFTLVEILVAVAIAGGLSLVMMNITKQGAQVSKKFQTDTDADFIMREIAGILTDPTTCGTKNFNGLPFASVPAGTIIDIKDKNNVSKYPVASATGFGSSNIKVASYTISNLNPVLDTNTETELLINFAMPKIVNANVATIKPRRIKLTITKTGANIASCQSAWVNSQDYWTKGTGANINDIYYNSGNVGIGTTAPTYPLHVQSSITGITVYDWNKAVTGYNYAAIIQSTGVGATQNVGGYFYAAGATTNYGVEIVGPAAAASNYAIYSTASAQSYFAGNVGIGTATPLSTLSVGGVGSANATIYGRNTTIGGYGVYASADIGVYSLGSTYGVYSSNTSAAGAGVYGGSTAGGIGVNGSSSGGIGGYFTSGTGYALITGTGNVGIGTATPGQRLEINGGLALNTATAKPTCSATSRGTFWVTQAAAGTKDSVEVCSKDAANAYAWSALGGGGTGSSTYTFAMNVNCMSVCSYPSQTAVNLTGVGGYDSTTGNFSGNFQNSGNTGYVGYIGYRPGTTLGNEYINCGSNLCCVCSEVYISNLAGSPKPYSVIGVSNLPITSVTRLW